MSEDKMQQQRFELKYLFNEDTALAVRRFASSYLDLDEFAVGKPNNSYTIHSLYMDSDDLRLYWGTLNGTKNRFKLRLRFYNEKSPVFFEIKRRMNNCIMKQRAGVKREHVQDVLRGNIQPDFLIKKDARSLQAVQNYVSLANIIQARPKVHISYDREAWVTSENNSIRLTFDRNVMAERELVPKLLEDRSHATRTELAKHVILELKFTGRYPYWFRDLVETFGLVQIGAAKYCEGVNAIGEDKMLASRGGSSAPLPVLEGWSQPPITEVTPQDLKHLKNKK